MSGYTKTTPQHVKAANLIEKKERRTIRAGESIKYIKTKTKLGVKPLQTTTKDEVDVDKYIELLHSIFSQLSDALGLSAEESPSNNYTKLENFM